MANNLHICDLEGILFYYVKFIYSEKANKFSVNLFYVVTVKSIAKFCDLRTGTLCSVNDVTEGIAHRKHTCVLPVCFLEK